MATPTNTVSGWVGWVYFAGILMVLRGASQAFLGITALINHQYLLISGNNQLIYSTANTNAWGWVDLAVGLLILGAGFSVMHGSTWARVIGVLLAGASFLVNMAFLTVFPVWSIVAMVVDVFIIYALVVHGRDAAW